MPNDGLIEDGKSLYGFLVVIAGFVLVGIVFYFSIHKWLESKDVTAAVGSVTSVVGTLAGAFFGVNIGAAGKARAESERNSAQKTVAKLAALVQPSDAAKVLDSLN